MVGVAVVVVVVEVVVVAVLVVVAAVAVVVVALVQEENPQSTQVASYLVAASIPISIASKLLCHFCQHPLMPLMMAFSHMMGHIAFGRRSPSQGSGSVL